MMGTVNASASAFVATLRDAIDIPMPVHIAAAHRVEYDATEIRVRVGALDQIRITIGSRLDVNAWLDKGAEAVRYAEHVNECREGIRDLVDQ